MSVFIPTNDNAGSDLTEMNGSNLFMDSTRNMCYANLAAQFHTIDDSVLEQQVKVWPASFKTQDSWVSTISRLLTKISSTPLAHFARNLMPFAHLTGDFPYQILHADRWMP